MSSGTYSNESYWYIEGTYGADSLTANNCHHCQAVGLGGDDSVTLNNSSNNELGFVAGWNNVQYDTTSNLYNVEKYVQKNITYFSANTWLERRPSGSGNNTLNLNFSDYNVALMGDGKNIVNIYNSNNNQVRVGNGRNTFTISNGTKNVLVAGYGANDVIISGGSYNMFAADASQVNKGQKNNIRLTGGNHHFVYTESGDDVIYIEKNAGDNMMVVTGGGNDTINVSAGKKHVIWASYAEDVDGEKYIYNGNNTINLTNTAENVIITGDGADKLIINDANVIEANLGSGKDEIILSNTNGRKNNGALSQIHGDAWGDTFTVKAGSQKYQLYGDAGDDVFNISGGSNMNFWGGAANDTFNVTGGTNNRLYGGDSADMFNISAGKQNLILGYGNDVVNVTAGDEQQIKGNLGINTINLKAGSGHIITADIDKTLSKKKGYTDAQIAQGIGLGYGQDKVYISGTASNVTANLGDGRDVVTVTSGSGHKIYTEGWGDTVKVDGEVTSSIFDTGTGNDTIVIGNCTNNTFYAGTGNDRVEIKSIATSLNGTAYNDIYLGDGDDKLDTGSYEKFKYNKISGGSGNDTIIINSWYAHDNIISGGSGDDVLGCMYGTSGAKGQSTIVGGIGNDYLISSTNKNLLIGGKDADTYALGAYSTGWVDVKNGNEGITDRLIMFDFTYMNDNASNIFFKYDDKNDIMRIKCDYGTESYIEGFSLLKEISATNKDNPLSSTAITLGSGAQIISKLSAAETGFNYSNIKAGYGVQDMANLELYTSMQEFHAKENDFKVTGNI